MTGIDIDRAHFNGQTVPAAHPMTTAEMVDAWMQHRARVLEAQAELAVLTDDQRLVLTYIAKGFNAKEIAKFIGRSSKTVDLHAMKMREALGMTTFEAVERAIRAGWV